jgi:transposase InsO family protein
MAELRHHSMGCEFGNTLDDMLRDRLVCGVRNKKTQRTLLATENLTFARAKEIACSMEMADRDMQIIEGQTEHNEVMKIQSGPKVNMPSCSRCGAKHPTNSCRHINTVCHSCRKRGHLARVCRTRDRNRAYYLEEQEELEEVNVINWLPSNKVEPFKLHILMNGERVQMEIDTGAAISIMGEETFLEKWPENRRPIMWTCKRQVETYTGEVIEPKGEIEVDVTYKGLRRKLTLVILPGKGPTLLGRSWIKALKIREVCPVNYIEPKSRRVKSLLEEYSEVFKGELGTIKHQKAVIQLIPGAVPVFCKPRGLPYAQKEKVEQELNRLEKLGVIEETKHCDWAAPIVPVTKPDGSIRICGDYKLTVNKFARVDHYPLPKISELLSSLVGGKCFSKLDLSNAYQQVELDENSMDLTTINTQKGLYRYRRLPFGISAAPGFFQRLMENIMKGISNVCVYLDDILVSGNSLQNHNETLKQVLQRLQEHGVKLNKEKSKIAVSELTCLGHVISDGGIRPSPDKLRAVVDAPEPSNTTELKAFIGLVNYYGRFLKNLSTQLHPLYQLLKKNKKWEWGECQRETFKRLKERLQAPLLLIHYDPDKELELVCDASPYGVGAVLSQKINGKEQPVCFASRTLSETERKYSQVDKEALAIIFGVKKFHEYLFGRHFTIFSDHKPLMYLFGENKGIPRIVSARIQRWALILSSYSYSIRYRPGKEVQNADALSRLPVLPPPEETPIPSELVQVLEVVDRTPVTARDIKRWTSRDPVLAQVMHYVNHGWPNKVVDGNLAPYSNRRLELSSVEGCLTWGSRIIIPSRGRQLLLKDLHSSHPGASRMKSLARQYVWWPNMDKQIENLVQMCNQCQAHRATAPEAHHHPWEYPKAPWRRIHIDHAGPFQGKYFLVVVDAFTKWVEVEVVKNTSSNITVERLRKMFSTFGIPETLVSDNGSSFCSQEFKKFINWNGIKHLTTPYYHPNSNGLAERAVRTFKENIKMQVEGTIEEKIAKFLFNYRLTPHSTTGESPCELMFGRKIRSRWDLLKPNLQMKVQFKQAKQQLYDDRNSKIRNLQEGDKVWIKNFRGNKKWTKGKIIKSISTNIFIAEDVEGRKRRCHIDHVRVRRGNEENDKLAMEVGPEDIMIHEQEEQNEEGAMVNGDTEMGSTEEARESEQGVDTAQEDTNHSNQNIIAPRRSSRISRPPEWFAPTVSH